MVLSNFVGKRILVYEGSTKIIYAGTSINTLILHFKDQYMHSYRNKVVANIWDYLNAISIKSHFIEILNIREHLVHSCNVYPVFIRIHNIAIESLMSRFGIENATILHKPLIEWHLKSAHLGDPIISEEHMKFFGWLNEDEIEKIASLSNRVNEVLKLFFLTNKLRLATIDLHFGLKDDEIILVGEISPHTVKFWDKNQFRCLSEAEAYNKMFNISTFET